MLTVAWASSIRCSSFSRARLDVELHSSGIEKLKVSFIYTDIVLAKVSTAMVPDKFKNRLCGTQNGAIEQKHKNVLWFIPNVVTGIRKFSCIIIYSLNTVYSKWAF